LKKSLFQISRQDQPAVGFGSVRTGYVNNKRISLLTRASSAEPPNSQTSQSPAPTKRQKSVRFSGNGDSVMIRSPSPRPLIKTGDVATGVANWTQRVSELDKNAAAVQTPPAQRRATVMKFGSQRASSESRAVKLSHQTDEPSRPTPVAVAPTKTSVMSAEPSLGQHATMQNVTRQSFTRAYMEQTSDSQQINLMGSRHGSISSLMSIVPESERSSARLSPPISICSEKSA